MGSSPGAVGESTPVTQQIRHGYRDDHRCRQSFATGHGNAGVGHHDPPGPIAPWRLDVHLTHRYATMADAHLRHHGRSCRAGDRPPNAVARPIRRTAPQGLGLPHSA